MLRGLQRTKKVTIKKPVPLPRIEVWNQLSRSKYYSTIDLRLGYHQICIRENDVEKAAFRSRYGIFEYLVTLFGLRGDPGCFQTLMNIIFRPYIDKCFIICLDDILIHSKTEKEHFEHLKVVLDVLRRDKLYGIIPKCAFMEKLSRIFGAYHRMIGN